MEIENRLSEVPAELARALTGSGLTTVYGIFSGTGGFVDQAGSL